MNDYSIRELECFVAVAEELSFTLAAKRLNLAQPPLSRHIQALETRLETRLFDRTTRGVSITAAGRAFLQDTRSALTQLQRAVVSAKRVVKGQTSRLEIGFSSTLYSAELVQLFQRFRKRHPEVQIVLHDSFRLINSGKSPMGELMEVLWVLLHGEQLRSYPSFLGFKRSCYSFSR